MTIEVKSLVIRLSADERQILENKWNKFRNNNPESKEGKTLSSYARMVLLENLWSKLVKLGWLDPHNEWVKMKMREENGSRPRR